MKRVPFRWILSSLSMSRVRYGSHMTDPYSSTDQTIAMYAVLQQDIGQFLRLRRTNPSVELALLAVFAICFDHPKSSDNRIPRYGFSVTC